MSNKKTTLLPKGLRILQELGENIKFARLRRNYTSMQVAERANISRNTLTSIENGSESVSIGAYFSVMTVLGLENDFLLLAKDDVLGRKLQDAKLPNRERASKK